MLENPGLPTTKRIETPMEPEEPRQLQADPSGENPPLSAGEVTWVLSALGLAGYIVGHARPNGQADCRRISRTLIARARITK